MIRGSSVPRSVAFLRYTLSPVSNPNALGRPHCGYCACVSSLAHIFKASTSIEQSVILTRSVPTTFKVSLRRESVLVRYNEPLGVHLFELQECWGSPWLVRHQRVHWQEAHQRPHRPGQRSSSWVGTDSWGGEFVVIIVTRFGGDVYYSIMYLYITQAVVANFTPPPLLCSFVCGVMDSRPREQHPDPTLDDYSVPKLLQRQQQSVRAAGRSR